MSGALKCGAIIGDAPVATKRPEVKPAQIKRAVSYTPAEGGLLNTLGVVPSDGEPFPYVSWSISEALIIIGISTLLLILSFVSVAQGNLKGLLFFSFASQVALLGCTLYSVFIRHGGNLASLGWSFKGFWEGMTLTLAVCFATFFVAVLAGIISTKILLPEQLPVQEMSGQGFSLLVFIMLVVIPPVFEETSFRGYFYPVLRNNFNMPVAILVNSAVFAAFHLGEGLIPMMVGFVPRVILGCACCYLFERTGTLYTSMTCHALYNFGVYMSMLNII